MKKLFVMSLALLMASGMASAAGDAYIGEHVQTNIRSTDSLRSGARTYVNYCMGCHSMEFQRYNRVAQDLGLTEDEMMNGLILTDAKFTDKMTIAMDPQDAASHHAPIDAHDVPPQEPLSDRSMRHRQLHRGVGCRTIGVPVGHHRTGA